MATPQTHTIEQESDPWEQQAARFDLAAEKLKLDEGLWRVLRQPNREIIVHIPVMLDDRRLEVFTGFRCSIPSRVVPPRAECVMHRTSRSTKCARWPAG